jgi:hypothetical protein
MGCESRGIEVIESRNSIAEQLKEHVAISMKDHMGEVKLQHGRLKLEKHRIFLTAGGSHVVKAFCNNFEGKFAEGMKNTGRTDHSLTLDGFVAGLFSIVHPGSKLATLHCLPSLPGTWTGINEEREKHGLS